MQAYVAITRPTHLLCLAIRASSLEAGKEAATNRQRLNDRGWKVQHFANDRGFALRVDPLVEEGQALASTSSH